MRVRNNMASVSLKMDQGLGLARLTGLHRRLMELLE